MLATSIKSNRTFERLDTDPREFGESPVLPDSNSRPVRTPAEDLKRPLDDNNGGEMVKGACCDLHPHVTEFRAWLCPGCHRLTPLCIWSSGWCDDCVDAAFYCIPYFDELHEEFPFGVPLQVMEELLPAKG